MRDKYHTDYLSSPTILLTSNPLTGESSPSMEESEQAVEKLLSEYCTDVSPSKPREGDEAVNNDSFSLISLSEQEMQEEFNSLIHPTFGE